MSLFEIIIDPIIPNPDDQVRFFRFLKSVVDSDEPSVCLVTGGNCTGKTTLVQLVAMAVDRNCRWLPEEGILSKIYGRYMYLDGDFKLGILRPDYQSDLSKCFADLAVVLSDPEKFGSRHYLAVGDFEFPTASLDPSKYIHIHLDNEVPLLSWTQKNLVRLILDEEPFLVLQTILDELDKLRGLYIKG